MDAGGDPMTDLIDSTMFGSRMTYERLGSGPDHEPIPIEQIVESGLCIGCGLCQSIAGQGRIRLVMTPEGRERPAVMDLLDRQTLALINAVCPGVTVVGPDPKAVDARAKWDAIWGPAIRIVKGHAGDPQVRFQASAGADYRRLPFISWKKARWISFSTSPLRGKRRCARSGI